MSDSIDKNNNIFVSLILSFVHVFKYAFLGLRACTVDLFFVIYDAISWKLDKAYRNTKDALVKETSSVNLNSPTGGAISYEDRYKSKKKKEKTYVYSDKKMAKLELEYQELVKDLQAGGATRSKEPCVYLYKVREKNGKITTGHMTGFSKLDVNVFLLSEGFKVYSIKTSPLINFLYKDSSLFKVKMSTKELVFWLTQLSTYIKAGITLNDAVKILSKQMTNIGKTKQRIFLSISYELTLGESFSNALEKQGDVFPALLINMVKAAEASGTLTETLDDMANYYTEINSTKKEMKSAMAYPAVITVFALIVVFFILIVIIPKFTDIYASSGAKISGLTQVVIDSSVFLKENYLLLLAVFVGIIFLIFLMYKYVKAFRGSMQVFLMHIPIIKNVIIYNELTIFTKTFASLLRNNVFITDSVSILSKITNNEVYKSILYQTINNIVNGDKISDAFKDHWAIPDVAYFMIVTGESTGELAEMMQKVSDYYQEAHRNLINSLKSFIEPVMICVLAVVVGVILVAVIVPMFQLYDELLSNG